MWSPSALVHPEKGGSFPVLEYGSLHMQVLNGVSPEGRRFFLCIRMWHTVSESLRVRIDLSSNFSLLYCSEWISNSMQLLSLLQDTLQCPCLLVLFSGCFGHGIIYVISLYVSLWLLQSITQLVLLLVCDIGFIGSNVVVYEVCLKRRTY